MAHVLCSENLHSRDYVDISKPFFKVWFLFRSDSRGFENIFFVVEVVDFSLDVPELGLLQVAAFESAPRRRTVIHRVQDMIFVIPSAFPPSVFSLSLSIVFRRSLESIQNNDHFLEDDSTIDTEGIDFPPQVRNLAQHAIQQDFQMFSVPQHKQGSHIPALGSRLGSKSHVRAPDILFS